MSFLAVNIFPETQTTLAAASVVAGYTSVGTLLNPARMFLLQNLTDATIQVSLDGTNDHFPLPATSGLLLDLASNKSNSPSMGSAIPQNTTVYVKRIGTPLTGSVYLTPFYGKNG